jgi:hypothetical protein
MAQTPITESFHDGGFIVSEANGHRSRERITITGAKIYAGTVLGKVALGSATSAAKSGGNTGNGTLVLDVTTPILAGAIAGVYQVRCMEAVTNGGKFTVKDPNGFSLGQAIIVAGAGGTYTFSDQVKFAVTDGTTDFVVGDGFDITVAVGSGKYKAFDPTALDGTQNAAMILFGTTDASAADKHATGIARSAEVNKSELLWGAGVTTTDQKNAAYTQLAALGIIGR